MAERERRARREPPQQRPRAATHPRTRAAARAKRVIAARPARSAPPRPARACAAPPPPRPEPQAPSGRAAPLTHRRGGFSENTAGLIIQIAAQDVFPPRSLYMVAHNLRLVKYNQVFQNHRCQVYDMQVTMKIFGFFFFSFNFILLSF